MIGVVFPTLLASQFAWRGSSHLTIPVGHCSPPPFTWAVRELHTEHHVGDPTTLLRWIALRLVTQQAHHRFLFMTLVAIDSHFGNYV